MSQVVSFNRLQNCPFWQKRYGAQFCGCVFMLHWKLGGLVQREGRDPGNNHSGLWQEVHHCSPWQWDHGLCSLQSLTATKSRESPPWSGCHSASCCWSGIVVWLPCCWLLLGQRTQQRLDHCSHGFCCSPWKAILPQKPPLSQSCLSHCKPRDSIPQPVGLQIDDGLLWVWPNVYDDVGFAVSQAKVKQNNSWGLNGTTIDLA